MDGGILKDEYSFIKGYRASKEDLMVPASAYCVLDAETTGLNPDKDDLIRLSLFDPLTGLTYVHSFPLEKQENVPGEAKKVNGLSRRRINRSNPFHFVDGDVSYLIETFHLEKRKILIYSDFDSLFVKRYFKDHHLAGYRTLNFFSLKRKIAYNPYDSKFNKEDLAEALFVPYKKKEQGLAECFLVWQLFKKIAPYPLITILGEKIYGYTERYLIPASELMNYVKTDIFPLNKAVESKFEEICSCSIAYDVYSSSILKEALKNDLKAETEKDNEFSLKNHYLLTLLGKFKESVKKEEKDASFSPEDEEKIFRLEKDLKNFLPYLKGNVFHGGKVTYRELVKMESLKSYGYCDFSSISSSLTVKVRKVPYREEKEKQMSDLYTYQMYVTSDVRSTYLLLAYDQKLTLYKVSFYPYGTVYKRD